MAIRTNSFAGGRRRLWLTPMAAAAVTASLAGCGSGGSPSSPQHSSATQPAAAGTTSPAAGASSGAPAPAASNPPGDIPDTTIYVPFVSAKGHLRLKVPEGWSRKETATSSTFISNLNSISIAWQPMSAAPTVTSARSTTVPALSSGNGAFRLTSVRAVTLQGGPAVEIVYQVNSQPNAVTGRQYRLVIERFEFYKSGHEAVLSLSSAVGSDNVDPWRLVSESFRWG